MPVMRVGLQGDITGMERILGSLLAGTYSLLIKRLFVSLSVLSPQSMNVHQIFKTNCRRRQHNLLHLLWIEGTKTGAWISWKMEPKYESKFITAGVRDNCLCVFGLKGINKKKCFVLFGCILILILIMSSPQFIRICRWIRTTDELLF